MHLGVASPIVDLFVHGEVPREVRLLAAGGLVTAEGHDRLALLAWLTTDADAEVAARALTTIGAIPASALRLFLAREDVPEALRTWYAPHIGPALARATEQAEAHPERRLASRDTPPVGDDANDLADADPVVIDAIAAVAPEEAEEQVHKLLTSLPVPDKLKLATLGRREQRAILIRDPNRLVSTAVLGSPKLTDTEVENFSRMQNVSDEVLRIIGTSRVWTKNYTVVSSLVKNPRTPTTVSLSMVPRLAERDIKMLTVNRNVPESVRLAARKQLEVLQSRKS